MRARNAILAAALAFAAPAAAFEDPAPQSQQQQREYRADPLFFGRYPAAAAFGSDGIAYQIGTIRLEQAGDLRFVAVNYRPALAVDCLFAEDGTALAAPISGTGDIRWSSGRTRGFAITPQRYDDLAKEAAEGPGKVRHLQRVELKGLRDLADSGLEIAADRVLVNTLYEDAVREFDALPAVEAVHRLQQLATDIGGSRHISYGRAGIDPLANGLSPPPGGKAGQDALVGYNTKLAHYLLGVLPQDAQLMRYMGWLRNGLHNSPAEMDNGFVKTAKQQGALLGQALAVLQEK